jgi:hypothetical protein
VVAVRRAANARRSRPGLRDLRPVWVAEQGAVDVQYVVSEPEHLKRGPPRASTRSPNAKPLANSTDLWILNFVGDVCAGAAKFSRRRHVNLEQLQRSFGKISDLSPGVEGRRRCKRASIKGRGVSSCPRLSQRRRRRARSFRIPPSPRSRLLVARRWARGKPRCASTRQTAEQESVPSSEVRRRVLDLRDSFEPEAWIRHEPLFAAGAAARKSGFQNVRLHHPLQRAVRAPQK